MLGMLRDLPSLPHFASTESGQLEKLKELRIALGSGPQSFVTQAFGGNERLLQLHYMLTELTTERDLQCIICSRGYVGIIQNLLDQAQLGKIFNHILANVGDDYQRGRHDQDFEDGANVKFWVLLWHLIS